MSTELRYNPPFLPGDILRIKGYPNPGLVMSSKDAGVVEEIFHGHPTRIYQMLFSDTSSGFAFDFFAEDQLKEHGEKIGHLNFGVMLCGGTDISEVLFENRCLNERLGVTEQALDYWRQKATGGTQ